MIVSAHQPNYLPYPGLIGKIIFSDKFVYLGNVQFEKASWQSRNRLRSREGELLLIVPVSSEQLSEKKIVEIEIAENHKWKRKHKNILSFYRKAPYYKDFSSFFEDLYNQDWKRLYELDIFIMNYLLELFDIDTEILYDTDFDFQGVKTERLVDICRQLDCETYLSGKGSEAYLEIEKFTKEGYNHLYMNYEGFIYPQLNYPDFIPFLSIFDMLFNIGKDRTYQVISNRENYRFSQINKKLGGGGIEKNISILKE